MGFLYLQIMNSNEKKVVKDKILEAINDTELQIETYKDLAKPIAPENAIGRVSRMDAINNRSVNEAALSKAEQKLKNLRIALNNIDDDDFGICGKCKQQIPIGRILLVPQNRFCVRCAM